MKAYVCDACGVAMTNPHEAKMREFYVGFEPFCGHMAFCNVKVKKKVHLCDECYHSLHEIAKRTEVV